MSVLDNTGGEHVFYRRCQACQSILEDHPPSTSTTKEPTSNWPPEFPGGGGGVGGWGWGWGGQLARSKLLNEAEREERRKNGSPNSLSGASPPVVSNGLHLELTLALAPPPPQLLLAPI